MSAGGSADSLCRLTERHLYQGNQRNREINEERRAVGGPH